MPLTHTRTFRIRYYECDAYGHLNNTNYLRFMQEAAFDGSAASGYSLDRYDTMGCHWLVHSSEIEYLRPIYYNENVAVKTWVSDMRRASSRRMYEFNLASTGELAARGFSDWVLIDDRTRHPASIPDEMTTAFFPEGVPAKFPPRQPFPAAPPAPHGVYSMGRKVIWGDIDGMGHVNNAVYLEYLEECGMQVVAAHRWPASRMMKEGFAILLRKQQLRYLQPALLGDDLEISTWVSAVNRSSATRHYVIRRLNDNALILQAHTVGVWVDLSSGRPMRIPAELRADFAPNIATSEPSEVERSN